MKEVLTAAFTHLHVHSHFSLLAGTAAPVELARRAAAEGFNALALTDHGALYGAVQFQEACLAAGVKPIIGLALPLKPPPKESLIEVVSPSRLVLLARNAAGYRSLAALSSALQSSRQRARSMAEGVDWSLLQAHREGLICLDGGREGWTERFLRAGDGRGAARIASRLGGLYEEHAYLAIELHHTADEAIAREKIQIGARFGLRAAAVQPVYTLQASERAQLRLLAAIDHNCLLQEVPEAALPLGDEPGLTLHWQSPANIADRFANFPEALLETGQIATQCEQALPDGRPIWPALELPPEQSVEEALSVQATAGLAERYTELPASPVEPPSARLERELAAINAQGFAPLFLLVADITRYARENDVPVNTRGSVANSLVAYCLGISQVDPLVHDLLFERFLNPARANLPDIDLDFCSRRRDEILQYVRRKYGVDRVALVATISTLQPKSAVRETAKAYGYDETALKKLTALVPRYWHPDPRRRDKSELPDLLAQLADKKDQEIMTRAYSLVGQPHHLSIHPGGVVITPGPLTDVVPVQLAPKGFLITQFDHRDVEKIGLPKLDLLGIRALTVMADTAKLIRRHHDPYFRLEKINLADEETAVTLQNGQTIGVFQCESSGAQRTLRQLRARNVQDLAIANAFFKPGPATGGMAQAFIRRYRGEAPVSFLHPRLEPILQATKGVLLFQEQVLRVATEVAGLSWAEADHLRRGMSKFKSKEMATMQLRFVIGCQEKSGFAAEDAETLWEQVIAFAGYGFNQGHATAYADISYRSAYLRTHFPAEFLCARLADAGGFHHPLIYIMEARRLGFPVRGPHVNQSGRKFTLVHDEEGAVLWMGLGQVRALRHKAVLGILSARKERPFASLTDLLRRVPLQSKEQRHLIQCGACDGLGESRTAMMAELESVARAGTALQMHFPFAREETIPPEGIRERLAWERHILGWPMSVHPLALVARLDAGVIGIRALQKEKGFERAVVAGVRLPGWTGGKGFFLGDADSYIIVRLAGSKRKRPPLWQPAQLWGAYREDEWGNGWFEAESIKLLTAI